MTDPYILQGTVKVKVTEIKESIEKGDYVAGELIDQSNGVVIIRGILEEFGCAESILKHKYGKFKVLSRSLTPVAYHD